MPSTHIDADTAKSAMTLLGAVLVFISTASAIVNNRLDRARNAAAKERVVSTAFGCALVILQAVGCVMLFTIGAVLVFVSLFFLSVILLSVNYLRRPEPLPRMATLALIIYWSFLVFIMATYFHIQ